MTFEKNKLNNDHMKMYDKSKYEKLKYKFPGSETIINNNSQAYQDMFVLTMLNGKQNGTFLEIGAWEAIENNNTYLLEKEFGWGGVSIDIGAPSLYSFLNNNRQSKFILSNALTLNYKNVALENNLGTQIDYLQIDIDPTSATLACLKLIPFNDLRFSVITYETDLYFNDETRSIEKAQEERQESRDIILSHGYKMIVGNVGVIQGHPFEDWYVDPNVIPQEMIELFQKTSEYNDTGESILLYE